MKSTSAIPYAPYPPSQVRNAIAPDTWQLIITSWTSLSHTHLSLSSQDFQTRTDPSLIIFLTTYFANTRHDPNPDLAKSCFLLTHRLLSQSRPDQRLLEWTFLADFAHAYAKTQSLSAFFDSLPSQHLQTVVSKLQPLVADLTSDISGHAAELKRPLPLIKAVPACGHPLVAGSDLIDALQLAYEHDSASRKLLTIFTYVSLISLTRGTKPNKTLLLDHLYSLKEYAAPGSNLLSDLVTNTPILNILSQSQNSDARTQRLVDALRPYEQPALARRRTTKRSTSSDAAGGLPHVHRMSLVTQIQDLFPDLDADHIARLLDAYGDNVEIVTCHLLENTLPDHLKAQPNNKGDTETPQPARRTVFDNDDFDRLQVDPSKIRREKGSTTDIQPNKAAILSALAAFDSDDDERDDTYDEADVGGTVAGPVDEEDTKTQSQNKDQLADHDIALFRAWTADKTVFARTARHSAARNKLKDTGLSDEMIEGWATMLTRDPTRQRRLEHTVSDIDARPQFDGTQNGAESDGSVEGPAYRSTRGRGGRVLGSSRGGGPTRGAFQRHSEQGNTGPSDHAKRKKEANKSSRANHDRRDQRSLKMARAGSQRSHALSQLPPFPSRLEVVLRGR